ncbi:MAG: CPBP family intramembrane metalloprotease [Calditrichaeota bacterium]|nr:CPBP family intramembrane metalloprotease [Calditrichota bacterium]
MKENYILALKIFIRYFIFLWLINLVFSVLISFSEISLEGESSLSFYINLVYFSLHILLLFYFIRSFYLKNPLLFATVNFIKFDVRVVSGAVLLGFAIGSIFPMLTNSAVYVESIPMLKDTATTALKSYSDFFNDFNVWQLLTHFVVTTLLLSIFREIFFRGILQRLIQQDENITKATIQVSLLFTLTFFYYQFNYLDFISLFVLSIFLSYTTFITKSILPAIFMSIAYDLPVFILYFFSDLSAHIDFYLTYQESFAMIYLLLVILGYFGFKLIELGKK